MAPAAVRSNTPRGQARRAALLDAVVDDLLANGLVDFSLRRAAAAAGATHKVLRYHFGDVDALLREALGTIRARRVEAAVAASSPPASQRLSQRVVDVWQVLVNEPGPHLLEQAVGLSLYDPARHRALGSDAISHYLPEVMELCPPEWDADRRAGVAVLILASLRGLLADFRSTGEEDRVRRGLEVLTRMLDREAGWRPD